VTTLVSPPPGSEVVHPLPRCGVPGCTSDDLHYYLDLCDEAGGVRWVMESLLPMRGSRVWCHAHGEVHEGQAVGVSVENCPWCLGATAHPVDGYLVCTACGGSWARL
jgi:hypothetical protein